MSSVYIIPLPVESSSLRIQHPVPIHLPLPFDVTFFFEAPTHRRVYRRRHLQFRYQSADARDMRSMLHMTSSITDVIVVVVVVMLWQSRSLSITPFTTRGSLIVALPSHYPRSVIRFVIV